MPRHYILFSSPVNGSLDPAAFYTCREYVLIQGLEKIVNYKKGE